MSEYQPVTSTQRGGVDDRLRILRTSSTTSCSAITKEIRLRGLAMGQYVSSASEGICEQ